MFSPFIRVLLALIGLSPILLSLYAVKIIHDFDKISIYTTFSSGKDALEGLSTFLQTNYLLTLFIVAIILAHLIISKAKNMKVGRIKIKSIKPGDNNFLSLLFSIVLPFYKFYDPTVSDKVYMVGFIIVAIVYGLIMKGSYHFNIILKLFLGYRHYEIATMDEVTYILLSKNKLINRNQISEYVFLTDHMLVNVSK